MAEAISGKTGLEKEKYSPFINQVEEVVEDYKRKNSEPQTISTILPISYAGNSSFMLGDDAGVSRPTRGLDFNPNLNYLTIPSYFFTPNVANDISKVNSWNMTASFSAFTNQFATDPAYYVDPPTPFTINAYFFVGSYDFILFKQKTYLFTKIGTVTQQSTTIGDIIFTANNGTGIITLEFDLTDVIRDDERNFLVNGGKLTNSDYKYLLNNKTNLFMGAMLDYTPLDGVNRNYIFDGQGHGLFNFVNSFLLTSRVVISS